MLVVHGHGEHAGRYAGVADALTALGLHVRGYDLRGHGRSPGPRGVVRPQALIDDLIAMFEQLASDVDAPGPPFVLAHSMGGAIATGALTQGLCPRGVILSSPALALRLSPLQRLAVAVGLRVIPHRPMGGTAPQDAISTDPEAVAQALADPLIHDRITLSLTRFMAQAGARAARSAPRIHTPILLLVSGADRHVDPAGARTFFDALPPGVGTLHWYDDLLHEVFQEREPDRARVIADMSTWLQRQLER